MFNWSENIVPLPSFRFSNKNESSVIRSRMESGRFRQRRRFTAEHETASLSFDLTDEEYASWKSIWTNKLSNGSDWFTMRLPIGDGQLLTLAQVRFTSNYSANHDAFSNWSISAPIEYFEAVAISEDVLDVIIDDGYDTTAFEASVDEVTDEVTHMNAQHSFT